MFKLATQKRPDMVSFLEDGRKLADALQTLADREADPGTGSLDHLMPRYGVVDSSNFWITWRIPYLWMKTLLQIPPTAWLAS